MPGVSPRAVDPIASSPAPGLLATSDPAAARRRISFPPNLGTKIKLVFTHFASFDDFYGQFSSISDEALKKFEKDLGEQYRTKYNPFVDSAFCDGKNPVGQFCAALFESEYYRCKVLEDLGTGGMAKVYYTDYGNSSDVDKNFIFPLAPQVCRMRFESRSFFIKISVV
jgi:hypothetical protein